jgi:hypothetical protein
MERSEIWVYPRGDICPGLRFAPSGLQGKFFLRNLKIPIDGIPTLLYIFPVLSNEGRFLEASLQQTERELAAPGRPGTVDRLVAKVERREAQRPTSLGARGSPCRARWVR